MTIVELDNIGKTYLAGAHTVEALKPTTLALKAGTFIAVMGPSGSGKSTLLNLLGLLDRPTAGSYVLDGQDVSRLDDNRLSEIRCLKIGFVFQSFNLFSTMTVLDNVRMPMRYAGFGRREMRLRATRLLERLGLGDRLRHRPTQLSGGQCQRVAIARALANDPPIVLADEPTGNLDEKTGQEVLAILKELRDEGRTIIMVTHNPEYEAEVERTIVLHDGAVTKDTTEAEFMF